MVKKSDNQKKRGGVFPVETILAPAVLLGLQQYQVSSKKDGVTGPIRSAVRKTRKLLTPPRNFMKGGEGEEAEVAAEVAAEVSQEVSEVSATEMEGGKKVQRNARKGGDNKDQDQEQDGGKKKARKAKKGGDAKDQDQDQDQEQDGGKKKARKAKKGGDCQSCDDKEQDGGKKKVRRARKQRGGEGDVIQEMVKDLTTPELVGAPATGGSVVNGTEIIGQEENGTPQGADFPGQVGGKKVRKAKKGGALDLYAEQLRTIREKLEGLVRDRRD